MGAVKRLTFGLRLLQSKNLDQLPRRVKVEDAPDVGVRANLRYVAGEVLPRNEVLGSYAIAYSTPGALEVVDSLIQPFATDQKVCLLDILLRPEHVGKPYAEVAALAIERGAVPLGTVRAPSEEDPDQEGPVSCSVLMGPLDTVPIGPGDRLVVLATLLWAKKMRTWARRRGSRATISHPSRSRCRPRPSSPGSSSAPRGAPRPSSPRPPLRNLRRRSSTSA